MWRGWSFGFGALLLGCGGPDDAVVERYELAIRSIDLPDRAGDPIGLGEVTLRRVVDGQRVALCGSTELPDSEYGCDPEIDDPIPRVIDAAGDPVDLVPLVDGQGDTFAWAVPEPGVYRVVGVAQVPGVRFDPPWSFELYDWGEAPSFDPQSVNDTVWLLETFRTMPADFSAASLVPPLLVEVSDVDVDGARVRVVVRAETLDCVGLTTRVTWAGSALVFAEDRLVVDDPTLGAITGEDLSFSIAWRSGSSTVADARAEARVDTAPLSALLADDQGNYDDGDVCELALVVGPGCIDCDSGSPYCVGLRAYDGRLTRQAEVLPRDLPLCGVDLGDVEVPTFDCDVQIPECSCATGTAWGAWPTLALLVVLVRRRAST